MKSTREKWAVKAAGAGALALMLAVPSFAQSRGGERRTESRSTRTYRDNERVTVQGHVSSFSRERDGYRVQLDRGRESYWVPQSYFRNRGRDLRVGISIALGGIFRAGSIYVDAVSWPDDRGYRDGAAYNDFLGGIVERVDYRGGYADIREDRSGRMVRVEFRDRDRRGRLSLDDVRRGDYVELSGSWGSRGIFDAWSIDSVRDTRR